MSFSTFLYTYLLGGLTFLPLLLLAILVPGWLLLPEVPGGKKDAGSEDDATKEAKREIPTLKTPSDVTDAASSGVFAVLRRYDLPAALAALNAKNNASTGATSTTGGDNSAETGHGSESVYQSMYRSVFDRSKNAGSTTSILDNEDASPNAAKARTAKSTTPANIFHIVLRHGHLMLYDSNAEREVRHVVRLAHYNISLSSGPHDPDERDMKDADLFIKRTAIVLTPVSTKDFLPNGGDASPASQARPFYLFSTLCIEKEDFYHALLSTRNPPPIPQPLDTDSIIKLQSTLHSSSSLTPEMRALNALISRIFLGLHQTDRLKTIVRNKIEKKISRVQKPAFIAALAVHSIDLGDAAPVISNPRLQDLNIGGDTTIGFDIKYTGGVKVTVSALAKLDLGPRFKTRTADLLLSTCLQRLQGHMLIRIKPSPSNRLWFCFETIPEMDIKVEPVVSQRQITYTFILRAIEDRIRTVVAETLVKPNWDDVAFFNTSEQLWRGGIWSDETAQSAPVESSASDSSRRHQKTMSMPVLANGAAEVDSSATSSGSEAAAKSTTGLATRDLPSDLKRRSVNSLPLQSNSERELHTPPPKPPRPLKSPSLTSPSASAASVQLDESPANVDPLRAETASDAAQQNRWRLRPAPQQIKSRKDAIETMREMRDRAIADQDGEDENNVSLTAEPTEMSGSEGRRSSESPAPSFADRTVRHQKRLDSTASTASGSTTRSQRQQEAVQKGKTLFAATAAATNAATIAAKNWSWTTIANRNAKGGRTGAQGQQQEPVGRGQPLPPPGMPLPGPQKGWLPTGMGSVKRKPIVPQRKSVVEKANNEERRVGEEGVAESSQHGMSSENGAEHGDEVVNTPASEYGPWTENSGGWPEGSAEGIPPDSVQRIDHEPEAADVQPYVTEAAHAEPVEHVSRKVPPPLPARRHSNPSVVDPPASADVQSSPPEHEDPPSEGSHQGKDVIDDVPSDDAAYDQQTEAPDVDTNDPEDLVAIPAPADDDADEAELEAEGVQEDDHLDSDKRRDVEDFSG